ncbi:MAG: cobyric acid synthase [Lachnospiraceae bacterium]
MAKNLMIQGTMSNAGKSLLVAGILRVLKQDGYRAAPFKSQNMALNSYITGEGLEMGRAQVMQAEAAGIEPQVCMNPILLKPTSDVGSQVIVNGEVKGNYSAAEYFKQKKALIPDIMAAYHKLEEQADIIVIEGAGSPAEINLKADDIVNMGMAKLVDAPVLLVGDIDRGGVFAQLLGTVLLLEKEERERIKGFIINKFRGDAKLLEPGPAMLYEKCGIKTLGVMPYLNIQIDDEDSLSEQLAYWDEERSRCEERPIHIAVIKLPHLSNFTDFNPLSQFPFVALQYVERPEQLAREAVRMSENDRECVDLIILPGSKNTIQDMKWLRESGMEAAILKQAAGGSRIMGICGGYQMLGERIVDASGVEGGGEIRGMGLLPVTTLFREEKQRSRITGRVCQMISEDQQPQQQTQQQREVSPWQLLRDVSVSGYEIHMGEAVYGRTENGERAIPFSILEDGREDGCVQGRVLGTYLHGIWENSEFAQKMMELLCADRGLSYEAVASEWEMAGSMKMRSYQAFKETQYDLLAEAVRKHLDMDKIYEIILK